MSKIIRKKRLKIQSGKKGLEGILAHELECLPNPFFFLMHQSTVLGHNSNNNNNHKNRQTNKHGAME